MGMQQMIRDIEIDIVDCAGMTGISELDKNVLDAIRSVAREKFCPQEVREFAYDNRAMPIGHGQTISQPLIVALMTQLLNPIPTDKVLEVGTGSGYQAAVLSKLVDHIYSMEKVPELATRASDVLKKVGIDNVTVTCGNGCFGDSSRAPFNSIIVTAAADEIPRRLIEQLADNGRLVIPLSRGFAQMLCLVEKKGHKVEVREILPVIFVPLKC